MKIAAFGSAVGCVAGFAVLANSSWSSVRAGVVYVFALHTHATLRLAPAVWYGAIVSLVSGAVGPAPHGVAWVGHS